MFYTYTIHVLDFPADIAERRLRRLVGAGNAYTPARAGNIYTPARAGNTYTPANKAAVGATWLRP